MTGGPLCASTPFTGIVALSIMACFLWSLAGCTLVRFAQSFPWLCVFSQWDIGSFVRCSLLLQQRNAPNRAERRVVSTQEQMWRFWFDGIKISIEYSRDKFVVFVFKSGPIRKLSFKAHTNSELGWLRGGVYILPAYQC